MATDVAQPQPARADLSGGQPWRQAGAHTDLAVELVLTHDEARVPWREPLPQEFFDHEAHGDGVVNAFEVAQDLQGGKLALDGDLIAEPSGERGA